MASRRKAPTHEAPGLRIGKETFLADAPAPRAPLGQVGEFWLTLPAHNVAGELNNAFAVPFFKSSTTTTAVEYKNPNVT